MKDKIVSRLIRQGKCPSTNGVTFDTDCPQDLSVGDRDTCTCEACWDSWATGLTGYIKRTRRCSHGRV